MTSAEFKRWLERQGATFEPAKGGHIWVVLRGRRTILPMHGSRKEMKREHHRCDQEAARHRMRFECALILQR